MPLHMYHNPRCSKSRQTLELLQSKGVEPEIVLYLETPPDEAELRALLNKLGLKAQDLLRKKEKEYSEAGLSAQSTDDEVIAAMLKFPRLIERPIVINGNQAAIGRPPENVLTIL